MVFSANPTAGFSPEEEEGKRAPKAKQLPIVVGGRRAKGAADLNPKD
jgi:hypothetical protein